MTLDHNSCVVVAVLGTTDSGLPGRPPAVSPAPPSSPLRTLGWH